MSGRGAIELTTSVTAPATPLPSGRAVATATAHVVAWSAPCLGSTHTVLRSGQPPTRRANSPSKNDSVARGSGADLRSRSANGVASCDSNPPERRRDRTRSRVHRQDVIVHRRIAHSAISPWRTSFSPPASIGRTNAAPPCTALPQRRRHFGMLNARRAASPSRQLHRVACRADHPALPPRRFRLR